MTIDTSTTAAHGTEAARTVRVLARMGLDAPALYVLIGAAGAGKSRVAAAFRVEWRLSLDACRERVSDDAGDQAATADAVAVFDAVLAGRAGRGLPSVVDGTNTEPAVRARLVDHARAHGMPVVAITVRGPLAVCLTRQKDRSTNRQVPPDVVAAQHAAVPTDAQLLAEGFTAVHDAADLDLFGLLLARSAAAVPDPLADIRAAFGDDLAAVFAYDPEREDSRGAFAVGGRQVVVRAWWKGADLHVNHWQARCDTARCDRCGGVVWAAVADAIDLAAVYRGDLPDDLHCDNCDTLEAWR
ncbi:MAG: AAA family ATPase [Streptomycetaceae bacterium]|nr:AAA family ATPase [Streptomycetaceae bacterium]